MTTKSDISKAFKELRKYGYLVFTFNDRRASTGGNNGWVDHVIMKDDVWLIEVKIGNDKLSKEQEELFFCLCQMPPNNIIYRIATENNYTQIIDEILKK